MAIHCLIDGKVTSLSPKWKGRAKNFIIHEITTPYFNNRGIYTYDHIMYLDCTLHQDETNPYTVTPLKYQNQTWVESSAIGINAWMPNTIYQMPNDQGWGYITNLNGNKLIAIFLLFFFKNFFCVNLFVSCSFIAFSIFVIIFA